MKNTGASTDDKTVLKIDGGRLTIAGDLDIVSGTATLTSGTLKVGNALKVGDAAASTFTVTGGILDAKSTSIFMTDKATVSSTIGTGATFAGGTVNLSDYTGTYTLADLTKMQALLDKNSGAFKVSMTNGKLNAAEATLDQATDTGASVPSETVTAEVNADNTVVTVDNGNGATIGSVKVEAAEGATDAAATELVVHSGKLTISGGIDGETKALVEGALSEDFKVTVGDSTIAATLELGFNETSSGTLDKTVSVTNNSTLAVAAGTFDMPRSTLLRMPSSRFRTTPHSSSANFRVPVRCWSATRTAQAMSKSTSSP